MLLILYLPCAAHKSQVGEILVFQGASIGMGGAGRTATWRTGEGESGQAGAWLKNLQVPLGSVSGS
eukprot:1160918-Pelagomonas_calceolata.AAC.2